MAINSHIQIPKRLLKNFLHRVEEDYLGHPTRLEYVYFLDLKDFRIGEEKITLFGTEYGFYSDETENILSKDAEGPFGNTISKLFKKHTELNKITFEQSDLDNLSNFVYYSFCRSEPVFAKTKSIRVSKEKTSENDAVIHAINKSDNIFCNHRIIIFDNKTNVEFVVPFNCVTPIKFEKQTIYLLLISPKLALGFYLKEDGACLNNAEYRNIEDNNVIDSINIASYDVEVRNRKYLIAKSKETLVRILNSMNKPILEKESEA